MKQNQTSLHDKKEVNQNGKDQNHISKESD